MFGKNTCFNLNYESLTRLTRSGFRRQCSALTSPRVAALLGTEDRWAQAVQATEAAGLCVPTQWPSV